VALGPKPRKYKMSLNKKVKRIAMCSALSDKVAGGNMVVVDSIKTDEYKTRVMVDMLKAVGAGKKSLVVLADGDAKVIKSFANIEGVKTASCTEVNVYDILNADTFVVAADAAKKLEEVFA
jgi:large subunit ribosomal protein L4